MRNAGELALSGLTLDPYLQRNKKRNQMNGGARGKWCEKKRLKKVILFLNFFK